MLFSRPEEETLSVPREPVDDTCPACAGTDIRRYPMLRNTGWALVVRCQDCLTDLRSEDPPTPFGFTYLPYSAYLRGL